VVAPDRPGIRSSTANSGYKVVDVGHDVVAVADALGEKLFGVIGWSGGGPYALAVAAVAGNRLLGTVLAAGMGPPDTPEATTEYSSLDLRMLRWSRERPRLARIALGVVGLVCRIAPGVASRSFTEELCPRDKEVYRRIVQGDQTSKESLRFVSQAFRGGPLGVVADYAAQSADWGFRLEDVDVPVSIWQGEDDRMIPPVHARNLTTRLPTPDLVLCPGEGHFVPYSHMGEMLRQAAALE
jgi:pimeloyl-ACP methyl ester carboxylesterase